MSAPGILLPGETISVESIPWSANKQLKLGPGLRQPSPGTYKATTCGILQGDSKKRSVYVESNGGRVRLTFDTIAIPITVLQVLTLHTVYTSDRRPRNRNGTSLVSRPIPLPHHASHSSRLAPTSVFRRC